MLQQHQLLLVCFAAFLCTADGSLSKLDQILKNIGKRYVSLDDNSDIMKVSNRSYRLWRIRQYDDLKELKMNFAESITQHIRYQTSLKDKGYQDHERTLMSLQDDTFTAHVCGLENAFNRVQFDNYLRRTRSTMDAMQSDAPYSYQVLVTDKYDFDMIIHVDVQSLSGLKSTVIWNINSKLTCLGWDCIYLFTNVTIGGGCTDVGTVNHNYTELSVRKDALERLKPGSNPDVQYLFDIFTPGSLRYQQQEVNKLPYWWLKGIDDNKDFFKALVCHDEEQVAYTKEEFNSWYKRFMQMWHPKEWDDKYINVNILEVKPTEISARIAMKLQIGAKHDATIHEWNFKLITSYNQHNDEKWYITQIEIPCLPHIKVMDANFLAYREVLGASFSSYVSDKVQWHTSLDFLKHFIKKGPVDLESCGTTIETPDQLSKSFLMQGAMWNTTVKAYQIPQELNAAKPDTSVELRVLMDPPVKKSQAFGSEWTFSIKWDEMDQFYYVYKVYFSCPYWLDQPAWWKLKPIKFNFRYVKLGA